jgi:hypothetical protein
MASKTQRELVEQKRAAVLARLLEIQNGAGFAMFSCIWDEQKLDALILVLGLGRVELY